MKHYNYKTLNQWIEEKLAKYEQEKGYFSSDVHFDELESLKDYEKIPNLITLSCEIFTEGKEKIDSLKVDFKFSCFVYLPLLFSDHLTINNSNLWQEVGKDIEPPSLYIFNADPIEAMGSCLEEYRRDLSFPLKEFLNIRAIYRCCRTIYDAEDEYFRGIYLIPNE